MSKSYWCIYENDHKLDFFIKEHKLKDVPSLLIQIFLGEEINLVAFRDKIKRQFPAATVLGYTSQKENTGKHFPRNQICLTFTLIEEKIFNFAYYDSETGLPNRMKFTEQLESALLKLKQRNERLALLVIDIDRFKNVNDSLGHIAGDLLLKETAERIRESTPKDSYLGRFGGDKFTLLITRKTSVKEIALASSKILKGIAEPIIFKEQELFLTASIGVSFFPSDGLDEHTLLKNADTAMNRSKKLGGNQAAFYAAEMHGKAMFRFELENYLRQALQKHQFYLCYQPLIRLKTGVIIGCEALLRWNHPHLGLVPPSEFIPIAEEVGIIDEIGTWVLSTACQQTKEWQQSWINQLGVSVNVSAQQFQHPGFIETVIRALKVSGLKSKFLTLELTESAMIQNMEYSIVTMKALQNLGVKVSIDDFGTGYSSLNYLRNLPINSLKIDQAFIRNLQSAPSDLAIVKAIITMGQGLAVDVVAEGVETSEQVVILRDLNCHYAQGYFIQKPLQPYDFEKKVFV